MYLIPRWSTCTDRAIVATYPGRTARVSITSEYEVDHILKKFLQTLIQCWRGNCLDAGVYASLPSPFRQRTQTKPDDDTWRPFRNIAWWTRHVQHRPVVQYHSHTEMSVEKKYNKFSLWLYCWRCRNRRTYATSMRDRANVIWILRHRCCHNVSIVTHSHHLVVIITLP